MQLAGKVAAVTGGNGGLGQRICHVLAQAGVAVAVVYARSEAQASAVAAELSRDYSVPAKAVACDLTDPAAVSDCARVVEQSFGRCDLLINDAAYNKWIPFSDLDALSFEEWQKILAVNLSGPLLMIKAFAPLLKREGQGRIVNVASIAGLAPSGSSIAYAVSKAGLIHLTRCMAVALAPDVLVNCVAPGYLDGTRATANLDPAYRERAAQSAILKRAADKDDIARQVMAFCQTDSITGQTLAIDAGRVFH